MYHKVPGSPVAMEHAGDPVGTPSHLHCTFNFKVCPILWARAVSVEWSVTKSCIPTSCHLCRSHKHTYMEFQQLQGMTVAVCLGTSVYVCRRMELEHTRHCWPYNYSFFSYLQLLVPTFSRHCPCTRDYLAHTYLLLSYLQPGLYVWTENGNGVHDTRQGTTQEWNSNLFAFSAVEMITSWRKTRQEEEHCNLP